MSLDWYILHFFFFSDENRDDNNELNKKQNKRPNLDPVPCPIPEKVTKIDSQTIPVE